MKLKVLDFILVPFGLVTLMVYHFWLLYRIHYHPTTTIIGINAINRCFWVRAMMEDVSNNGVLAVQTLRNNIMASTVLASTAIMLSSLVAVLMTSSHGDKSSLLILGYSSDSSFAMKFFSILVCFLVAFLLNIQSIRFYSHASILINVPFKNMTTDNKNHYITPEYVAMTINKGSYFWSLGLRAFYFSFPLFFWIFGPIFMVVCCFVLIFFLYFLDDFVSASGVSDSTNVDACKKEEDVELALCP